LTLAVIHGGYSSVVVRDPKRTSRAHAYPPRIYQVWISLIGYARDIGYKVVLYVLTGCLRAWRKRCQESDNDVISHMVSDLYYFIATCKIPEHHVAHV
jgi:hypothetical protein